MAKTLLSSKSKKLVKKVEPKFPVVMHMRERFQSFDISYLHVYVGNNFLILSCTGIVETNT